jgi:hypothetical protein
MRKYSVEPPPWRPDTVRLRKKPALIRIKRRKERWVISVGIDTGAPKRQGSRLWRDHSGTTLLQAIEVWRYWRSRLRRHWMFYDTPHRPREEAFTLMRLRWIAKDIIRDGGAPALYQAIAKAYHPERDT